MREYRKTLKGTIRYGDPVLCPQCVSQLRRELREIDTNAAILVAEADGYRGSTGADAAIRAHRNAGAKGSSSPVGDLIDEVARDLLKWMLLKRPVASRLGFVARPVTEVASWLSANASMYVYDREVAGPLCEVVHRWHARLEKRAKSGAALIHKPVPCPSCRKMGLEQERGAGVVKCRECGLIQSASVYDDAAADGAEAADAAKAPASAGPEKPAPRRRKGGAAA